ncbi:MAG TPA: XRE family transcriptional regulator [Cyanobacteria bacterium UBA11371]|nr:XRE family transcriptional regulator [Cyanobacteria bacterium UBA11371]HBE30380.1 XRE family transcriptional regulator [Cyanobacteria bacterium UBA11368]
MPFQAKLRIRELCDRQKITMSKLSRLSSVNYNTIHRWAHQPLLRMDADPLFRVCRALECTLDELIEWTGDETLS